MDDVSGSNVEGWPGIGAVLFRIAYEKAFLWVLVGISGMPGTE